MYPALQGLLLPASFDGTIIVVWVLSSWFRYAPSLQSLDAEVCSGLEAWLFGLAPMGGKEDGLSRGALAQQCH